MKHNNQLPNAHFHKEWQRRVKTWFDQPGRKKRRRLNRIQKAVKVAPRPVTGPLRPIVHCTTLRYNMRLREGRGFTLDELKAVGLNPKYARTIGIVVDRRRHNKCEESLKLNARRLRDYLDRLVVLPTKGAVKKMDKAAREELLATFPGQSSEPLLPFKNDKNPVSEEPRAITEEERAFNAFAKLRNSWADARYAGKLEKAAKDRAEQAATKKK